MAYEDLYNSDNSTTDDLVNNPWINNFATRGMLSGVQFLAETLGKPARALFGTLAGKPSELLNLVPFSDTLGITNPNESVYGRDLLRTYGLVDQEDNWGNFLGGLALDVAADPLNFVRGPLGALTRAGTEAAKAGKLERSIIGRMKAGQGGLFSIMDRPWYAEMIGMGKQNPIYNFGARDADLIKATYDTVGATPAGGQATTALSVTGKIGQEADLQRRLAEMVGPSFDDAKLMMSQMSPQVTSPAAEWIADSMNKGWSKATRATVPGTNFSPLAWMRSAFEPGAANVTGHPVVTDVFGEVNRPTYNKLVGDAAEAVGKSDIYGIQADYLNRLADTGLDNAQAAQLLHRAATSRRELGELKFIQDWATPQQYAVAREFAEKVDPLIGGIADPVRAKALDVGYNIGDTSMQGWKFPYLPRAKSESGNKLTTHVMARNEDLALLPGGGAMAEAMMMDDLFSGINKSSALKTQGIDPDVYIQQGIQKWAPVIKSEATDRLQKMYPATATDIPEALKRLTTDEGAAELASRVVRQAADLPFDMAAKGQFYRPDLATDIIDYTRAISKATAPRASAIETLAREAGDYQKMISKNPTTEGVHSLTEALKQIDILGGKATLANRLGIPEDELAKFGVTDDLVKALNAEVNPLPPTAKSGWASAVDAFRYGVTIPWPANLVRNWTSTIMDQGIAGTGATRNLISAQDFLRGNMTPEKYGLAEIGKMQSAYQKAIEHGVVGTDQVHALLGEGFDRIGNAAVNVKPAQPGKTVIQSLKDWARPIVSEEAGRNVGVKPLRELAAESSMNPTMKKAAEYLGVAVDPVRRQMGVMEQAHHFQNEATRLQQFANLLDEGYSARAAAQRVKINQRDFLEGSTPFVQNKLRNFVPFANFSVQNLRSQADMLSRQPGRYSTLINILNSGRESGGFVPGYASSGASIELPGAEPGQKRYLSSLGLTQEDEMMSGIASLLALRPEEGIRKIVSGVNPALKVPFEIATGTQVFSGRRLDDLKPSTAATVATLGLNPSAARFLSEMASGTPMARVFSTVDRVADYEKRGVGNLLLNLMTGTRTVDVDQEAASQIAARDTITKLLNASDQYKLREQLVVDPKWKGREEEMPEEVKKMFAQYQLLQQAAKKAVQERQAAGQR